MTVRTFQAEGPGSLEIAYACRSCGRALKGWDAGDYEDSGGLCDKCWDAEHLPRQLATDDGPEVNPDWPRYREW